MKAAPTPALLPPPPRKVFYGWWVLLALCATTFYIAGSFWWGFSVFFPAILEEFGWSRAQASLALTFQGLEAISVAAAIGYLVEKAGARRLMLFGLVTTGLGLILLGRTSSLWSFYGAFAVIAVGTSAAAGIVAQTLVVKWFRRQRGRATTVLMLMPGLGATLIIPVLTIMIDTIGWRQSLQFIGVGLWVLAVPVLLVVRDSPESMGLEPDGAGSGGASGQGSGGTAAGGQEERGFSVREVVRLRTFWFLVACFTLWSLAMSSVQPHLFVALIGIEMPRSEATLVVALLPALSMIGRLGFGLLTDTVDQRYLLAVAAATMAVGLAFLALLMARPGATWLAFPFLAFFAVGFGGSIPTRIVISGYYFGRQHFAAVFATLQAVSAWGGMVGPLFSGWVFDTTGSYLIAFALAGVLCALSLPLTLMAANPQPRVPSRQPTPP
ncbi:MAG: MFS transporter [Dehalococcoidia bacterium]|nr:MFS transporter [Dehalococcoidia bacterium]